MWSIRHCNCFSLLLQSSFFLFVCLFRLITACLDVTPTVGMERRICYSLNGNILKQRSWSQSLFCSIIFIPQLFLHLVSQMLLSPIIFFAFSGCSLLLPWPDHWQGYWTILSCECCVLFSSCRKPTLREQEGLFNLLSHSSCHQVSYNTIFCPHSAR